MEKTMIKKIYTFTLVIIFLFPLIISGQTPPEEFLGHKVGEDRILADYNQIQAYFQRLDDESKKLKVLNGV